MPLSDRYYGFEGQALLCEHVITRLFSSSSATTNITATNDATLKAQSYNNYNAPVASTSTASHPGSGPIGVGQPGVDTPPHSPRAGKEVVSSTPNLGEFIAYALYRTRLPVSITHQALLLLGRLKARYPSARGTSTSPHRLFLSSLMLSSKISMDDTYSNQSWTLVGQNLFTLREVNQMERELFAFLGWNVVVRDEELSAWVQENVVPYEAERTLMLNQEQSSRKSMEDRKRRRDSKVATATASGSRRVPPSSTSSSPSHSRSPSPESIRHRRASDAALAILHGAQRGHVAGLTSGSSRRGGTRSGSRTPDYRSSPYSCSSRSAMSTNTSCSSSVTSSPQSGLSSAATTPASTGPNTPHDSNSPVAGAHGKPHPHNIHQHLQEAMSVATW